MTRERYGRCAACLYVVKLRREGARLVAGWHPVGRTYRRRRPVVAECVGVGALPDEVTT